MYTWAAAQSNGGATVACTRCNAVQWTLICVLGVCAHLPLLWCVCENADVDVHSVPVAPHQLCCPITGIIQADMSIWSGAPFAPCGLELKSCSCKYVWCIRACTMHAFAAAGSACRVLCTTEHTG